MLTKTILKKALNVKHTAIDNVTFGSDDSIIVRVHPTKGEQCRCGKCGRKAPRYDAGSGLRRWRTCDMNTHKTYLESEVYRAVFQNGLTEYEYDHVFVGTYDGTFEPNPEEISELRYVPLTELKQDMLTHPERYAVWFFTALRIAEEWYSEIEVTAGQ